MSRRVSGAAPAARVRGADRPLCAVAFATGRVAGVDLDAVAERLLLPAVRAAGMTPLPIVLQVNAALAPARLDDLLLGTHLLAEVSVLHPAVAWAIGARAACGARPTVLVRCGAASAGGSFPLPDGPWHYAVDPRGVPRAQARGRARLAARLRGARTSPAAAFALLADESADEIRRLKTDLFRSRAAVPPPLRDTLTAARERGDPAAVRTVERTLRQDPGLADAGAGPLIDLYLSYRAVEAWKDMIALARRMPPALARTPLVREQLGFALNRSGARSEAARMLRGVIARFGPSSETCSLLGRVHKDAWEAARAGGDRRGAARHLRLAIDAYLAGFEADWRDAYPGINAVTLMEIAQPPDPRRDALLPVVRYAVARRLAGGRADYWDHASALELAVLAGDEAQARRALAAALGALRETWEAASTARNLGLIRGARARRGTHPAWAGDAEDALLAASRRR